MPQKNSIVKSYIPVDSKQVIIAATIAKMEDASNFWMLRGSPVRKYK
jgi:hypothetical protein